MTVREGAAYIEGIGTGILLTTLASLWTSEWELAALGVAVVLFVLSYYLQRRADE